MGIRVGIDTGGTFTDLVAVDESSGEWYVSKVPSNPARPVEALAAALEQAQFDPADVSFMVVGTTIGINAVLTRTGARVLYLTTKGFEDVPHIQRINRKNHYDFVWRKPRGARPPARLHRRRRAHRLRGRGRQAARPGLPARPAPGARRRGRRRGRVLPLLLPQPGVRAGGARGAGRDRPRPPGLAVARDRADLARVRARDRGDPRRLPEADLQPLRGGRHRGVRSPGRRLQVVAAEVQRRSRAGERGAEPPRPRPALGHRRRGDRRRVLRPRARGRPRRSCSTWAGRAATSA